MTPEEKAVIIGLYRQGNEFVVIALIVGYPIDIIQRVIHKHLNNIPSNSKHDNKES